MNVNYISWFATVLSIIGAFTVANGITLFGYCAFILGSIGWGYIGITNKDNALITMQGVFLMANIMGLYNAI